MNKIRPIGIVLDERDRAILRLLQDDGRLSNLELAQRINLSPSACLRRVKLLEESGLIARYVMLLDETLAGLPGTAFVLVTLDQQGRAALDAFEAEIKRHPEVTECCLLAGTADYMVRVAYVVAFLASDKASYVSGAVIAMDGALNPIVV